MHLHGCLHNNAVASPIILTMVLAQSRFVPVGLHSLVGSINNALCHGLLWACMWLYSELITARPADYLHCVM